MRKILLSLFILGLTSNLYAGDAVNKTTFQYLKSINTPDYSASDWIHQPTLPEVEKIYWEYDNDTNTIIEMDQASKDVVDADIAQAIVEAENDSVHNFDITLKDFAIALDQLGYIDKTTVRDKILENKGIE